MTTSLLPRCGACFVLFMTALRTLAAPPENYILQPHDLVEIKVFQEEDLLTTARLAADGSIDFPLIGVTRIGGKTVTGAVQTIRAALAADFIINPQVTMTVMEYAKRRFTVLGEVQTGGTLLYPDNEKITLLQAIGLAGGYSKIADPSRITLKRRVNGQEVVYKLNARKMARDNGSADFAVLPGDTITVGESIF